MEAETKNDKHHNVSLCSCIDLLIRSTNQNHCPVSCSYHNVSLCSCIDLPIRITVTLCSCIDLPTVLRKPRHVSATSLLRTLHWLPVKSRIQYKIACLCFQCLSHNTMPPYLSDLLHPYQPPRTLRSLDTSLLSVSRFCLETFGQRSFSLFGPAVWNSLPLSLRKTQCFSTFKKKLKTHLFEKHLS